MSRQSGMEAWIDHLAALALARGLLAVPLATLPARLWRRWPDLPMEGAALPSAVVTLLTGAVLGIRGFFEYSTLGARIAASQTLDIATRQIAGQLPADSTLNVAPFMGSALTPIVFALFTPLGLVATYLSVSGVLRVASSVTHAPMGDPLLTLGDAFWARRSRAVAERRARRARELAEGPERPERLYEGTWARLPDVDFVVVASRQKAGWDPGTFVITSEGWFTLGVPFDVTLPEGLRTVYPLTRQTTNEVLRKGVTYELPPLSRRRPLTPCPPATDRGGVHDSRSADRRITLRAGARGSPAHQPA